MRVAVTSTGNQPESLIDPRFGRCAYFAVYDTESKDLKFSINPAKDAAEGAGPTAVQFVAQQKVNKVISGDFGVKIKSLFDALNIEMQVEKDSHKTVLSIIKQF
jgi:predicted Fe-Mo cluster-binding NifX family protein